MTKQVIEIEDTNSLIFENPMENPKEKIIHFFQTWGWEEAKLQLWKMYKAASCHLDYETSQEREDLLLFTETIAELMKASYTLQKKWQESSAD